MTNSSTGADPEDRLGPLKFIEGPIEVAEKLEDFLAQLGRPTLLLLPGRDRSRCRALSTLLHGNEPSGVIALHRWLQQRHTPEVDLLIFIGAVATALKTPRFFYRQLPGHRDLNRCFREPFEGEEGRIAESLLGALERYQPECLVDIHNTSGTGPSFCISIINDDRHRALASLFSPRFVINHLRMGALMEHSEGKIPTITVECGGSLDPHAHECAYQGLIRYAEGRELEPTSATAVEVLLHPIRLELIEDASIHFHTEPVAGSDLTLPPDFEQRNFQILEPDQPLGWLGPRGLSIFRLFSPTGEDLTEKLFNDRQGELSPRHPLKAFMITPNPDIAKSDCLLYLVADNGDPLS